MCREPVGVSKLDLAQHCVGGSQCHCLSLLDYQLFVRSLQASHLPPKPTRRMDTAIPRLISSELQLAINFRGTYKATLGQRGEMVERKRRDFTRFRGWVEVARQPLRLLQVRDFLLGFRKWRIVTFTLREEITCHFEL